jgi:uncharacterized protein with von Willebrand factor type A (vWA) domain
VTQRNPAAADPILRNIVVFGRVLRSTGLDAGSGKLADAVHALAAVDMTVREQAYWALRCTLVTRREEIPLFDAAFAALWGKRLGAADAEDRRSAGEHETHDPEDGDGTPGSGESLQAAGDDEEDPDPVERVDRGLSSSSQERLRHLDFAAWGADELREGRALIARLTRAVPLRRSLRLEAARQGRDLDRRRTLRSAMRTHGHPVERAWRRRRWTERRLVLLIDVSGSMEPYARPILLFAQLAAQAARRVEAYTFGTRLTRLTPYLAVRDSARALRRAAAAIPDWGGGTRIGDNLKAFNDVAGPTGLTRGAAVIVVSDGWERDDPALLAEQMARLHRASHTTIWVNPLAGDSRYRPIAGGMAAALPYVDVFLAGHNVRSLEELAKVLEQLPATRSRGRPMPSARTGPTSEP